MHDLIIPKSDLNISRHIMPQILAANVPDFLMWLKGTKGVKTRKRNIPIGQLKPSQGELNPQKIMGMMKKKIFVQKPVLMSRDHYILDGHHRYAAELNRNPKANFPVYEIDLSITDLMSAAREYDKSFTKELHESQKVIYTIRKIRNS